MKVKKESEKVGLKLNIQKIKITASGPITSWQTDGETVETMTDFIFLGSKCHNLLLEYLFRGGVVGLVVFLLAFTLSGRKVKALSVGPIKNLIIAAIFGYTILCLFDGYYFNPVPYALFCLANNLVDLQSEYENNGVEA